MTKSGAGRRAPAHALPPVSRTWLKKPVVGRGGRHPKLDDMLVVTESVGQQCLRLARMPAFGAIIVGYFLSASVIVGSTSDPAPANESPTAHDVGISPVTAPTVRTATASVPRTNERPTGDAPPEVRIDPQFLARLQKVLGSLDDQAGQDQPDHAQQETDQTAIPTEQADATEPATPPVAPPA